MDFPRHADQSHGSTSTITEGDSSMGTSQSCQHQQSELSLNLDQLSFSDTRKLAAIRAKEMHHEMIMNTRARFERGQFPGGYRVLGVMPPDGLMGALSKGDARLVEASWASILKNADRVGVKLMLRCLSGKKAQQDILNLLKAKTKVEKASQLAHNPLAVSYGRRLVMAVSGLIANARNDAALLSYVKAGCKKLNALGFTRDDMEEVGGSFTHFMAIELGSVWNTKLEDAWDSFTSEIVQLGHPYMACGRSM